MESADLGNCLYLARLGLKVRLSKNIVGENDLKILGMAREAAAAVGLPVMVHIGDSHSPLPDTLNGVRQKII